MSSLKTKQQRFALRIALYVLWKNGFKQPRKNQVLNFIRYRGLLQFPAEELTKRTRSDHDEIWENDIAWKRKDLFMDGEIDSPERGHWRLTQAGIDKIDRDKVKWLKLEDPAERAKALAGLGYWTDGLISWMLKIAKGENLSLKIEKG